MEAHTNVDVIVDLGEFKALLDATLPLVFRGASTPEAARAWPDSFAAHEQPEGEPGQHD